jgi:preprotein translocase subunit SecD
LVKKKYLIGFTDFTFNEVSDKQINKGLDLEGGINVILKYLYEAAHEKTHKTPTTLSR